MSCGGGGCKPGGGGLIYSAFGNKGFPLILPAGELIKESFYELLIKKSLVNGTPPLNKIFMYASRGWPDGRFFHLGVSKYPFP